MSKGIVDVGGGGWKERGEEAEFKDRNVVIASDLMVRSYVFLIMVNYLYANNYHNEKEKNMRLLLLKLFLF
jgi:hypothetical protein